MSDSRRKRRPYRRILRGLALAPLVLAPHLLAGASAELTAIIAGAMVVSMVITLATIETAHIPPGARGLTALFSALLLWTVIQAAPLPCDWVTWLLGEDRTAAPRTVARLLNQAPYCSISVDPGLTWASALTSAACMLAFLVGAVHCGAGHRIAVIRAVALSGATIAVSALMHFAYAARSVYGIYAPRDFGEAFPFGPILNLNHLGGLCALTLPAMCAAALEETRRRRAIAWLAMAACTVVVGLMTLSRSGMFAVVLAIALVALVASRRVTAETPSVLVPGLVLTFAVVGTWFVFGSAILDEYILRDRGKIAIILSGLGHAMRQGFVGHGRGAFGIAAIDVSGSGDWLHYAESLPVQWIGDYGTLFGTLALAVPAMLLVRTLVISERSAPRFLASGLIAFGVQNLADFSIEMSGIAVVAAATLAAATAERSLVASSVAPRRTLLVVSALSSALVLALLPTHAARTVEVEVGHIARALEARRFERADQLVADALEAHPRNPAFALLAASSARARDLDETVHWLNLAMRSAPEWWSPHHEAALFFVQRHRYVQAVHEAKIVARIDRGRGAMIFCELSRRGVPLTLLRRIAPPYSPGPFLASCVSCLPPPVGMALDQHLLTWRRPPEATFLRSIQRALDTRRPADALTLAQTARVHYPRSHVVALARARALAALERPAEAIRALHVAGRLGADLGEIAYVEASIYARLDDELKMRAAIERYREASSGDPDALSRAEVAAATFEHQLGNSSEAIKAYERAFTIDGSAVHQLAIMRIANERGWEARAALALRNVCAVDPEYQACVLPER
jgi:tetratricopeptide (TPR) repeat protein